MQIWSVLFVNFYYKTITDNAHHPATLQTANSNLFFIFICARSDSRFEEFVADR